MKYPALVAEFIGTFALIFVGVLVIKNLNQVDASLIGVALGHGLAIACLVSATAAISGGHLNPAVSFGLFLGKKIDLGTMASYWVAQLLGATVAAMAAKFILYGDKTNEFIVAGTPALFRDTTVLQGIVAEAIGTFFLIFVVFGTAVDKRAPKVGGLFIGLTITMSIFAIGPLTGSAINPARWFGPAIITGNFKDAIVWIVGPLLGGGLAGLLYANVLEAETTPE